MKTFRIWGYALNLAIMVFFLAACDGGGGGSSSGITQPSSATPQATATTLSGTVADGYLQGARVFLDRNGNRQYDSGEPMAISGEGGVFTLSINPGEGDRYSVVAEVIAGITIDEDNGLPVADSYVLEAPPGRWQFVSPLSTLVTLKLQKNPAMTIGDAEVEVKRKLFGDPPAISLAADYIALKADFAYGDEARRMHNAAQVVASLMGSLRSEISNNLAGAEVADQQRLVAYLVSDEILRRGNMIGSAVDKSVEVPTIISVVKEEIDVQSLNRDRLDLYAAIIAQNPQVWDMEPPQIQQQSIADGAVVAVDAVISLDFDKALDPASIATDAISVRRVGGSAVPGVIDYNASLKQLRFIPNQMLFTYSDYEVVVSARLADHFGNRSSRDSSWRFSTTFDLTPPPLADIDPE